MKDAGIPPQLAEAVVSTIMQLLAENRTRLADALRQCIPAPVNKLLKRGKGMNRAKEDLEDGKQ